MTYDTKNRILHYGVYDEVRLSKLEHKFLICLSSGKTTLYQEIKQYLNVGYDLSRMKNNLENKTGFELRIKKIHGIGFRLENEIRFR